MSPLWKPFTLLELTRNMRCVNDDRYSAILAKIRIHYREHSNMDPEDWAFLRTRSTDPRWRRALHIYAHTDDVATYNAARLAEVHQRVGRGTSSS